MARVRSQKWPVGFQVSGCGSNCKGASNGGIQPTKQPSPHGG